MMAIVLLFYIWRSLSERKDHLIAGQERKDQLDTLLSKTREVNITGRKLNSSSARTLPNP